MVMMLLHLDWQKRNRITIKKKRTYSKSFVPTGLRSFNCCHVLSLFVNRLIYFYHFRVYASLQLLPKQCAEKFFSIEEVLTFHVVAC